MIVFSIVYSHISRAHFILWPDSLSVGRRQKAAQLGNWKNYTAFSSHSSRANWRGNVSIVPFHRPLFGDETDENDDENCWKIITTTETRKAKVLLKLYSVKCIHIVNSSEIFQMIAVSAFPLILTFRDVFNHRDIAHVIKWGDQQEIIDSLEKLSTAGQLKFGYLTKYFFLYKRFSKT